MSTQHHLGELVTSQTPGITCYGAYILNTRNGHIDTVLSKITVMATGGAGHVYSTTTNPTIATYAHDGEVSIRLTTKAKDTISGN